MRHRWRVLLGIAAVSLMVGSVPASAGHGADISNNIDLLAEFPNETGAVNSDIAFWGDRAFVGNYDGIRIFDISNPNSPSLLSDFRCHGPQNDAVVWGNKLLFSAIDRTQSGPNCGSVDVAHEAVNGWEGVRIFDVSDPSDVQQIGALYLDCGAHTITLAGQYKNNLIIWASSYPLRPGPTCGPVNGPMAGRDPLHGVIQVFAVPLNNPAAAHEIAEPPITYVGDPDNVFLPCTDHGLCAPYPTLIDGMRACHDITVFTKLNLAAAACAEQGQLWRVDKNGIPDTANPVWVYDEPEVDFFHSATFTWDGKIVNFIDESFGSGCPTFTPGVGDTGRMFFLDVATGTLQSDFFIPRTDPADPVQYCSAHLGNVVPVKNRYLLVNAWYTGGIDVIDFTDPTNPQEIAFYDDLGDNWSAYWYEGSEPSGGDLGIYATHGVEDTANGKGFQVFRAHIPGAKLHDKHFSRLNPQTQEHLIK